MPTRAAAECMLRYSTRSAVVRHLHEHVPVDTSNNRGFLCCSMHSTRSAVCRASYTAAARSIKCGVEYWCRVTEHVLLWPSERRALQ
jgi:hypothetical protein